VNKEEKKEEEEEGRLSLGLVADQDKLGGASYLKYEVVEKKGQKILVPVRYSIRN